MYIVEEVSLENHHELKKIINFLKKFNLDYENDIDYTIAVYNNGNIIATASKAKNILKCFAVSEAYQGLGISNSLVKKIEDRMFRESLYHFFVFTTSCNKDIFTSIGYQEIITSKGISLLENGNLKIERFLKHLKDKFQLSDSDKAAIVMNANPFTLGHRYLVLETAKKYESVIIFVVSEDSSSFPFNVRFKLIKEGVKDLENVSVIETGPYLISNATFPTYFLKQKEDAINLQANLDCEIFATYYRRIFNIKTRLVGNEPYCEVTRTYNTVMKEVLPKYDIDVQVIERVKNEDAYISASKVRELLRQDNFEEIKKIVPETTYSYLISDDAKAIIKHLKKEVGRH